MLLLHAVDTDGPVGGACGCVCFRLSLSVSVPQAALAAAASGGYQSLVIQDLVVGEGNVRVAPSHTLAHTGP
jgi:hypothetical protein